MNDPLSNPNLIKDAQEDNSGSVRQDDLSRPSIIPNIKRKPISGYYAHLWDDDLVIELSNHTKVQGIVALGTLCAVAMRNTDEVSGYRSTRAKEITDKLRKRGVFARPLGDIVYLMVGLTTSKVTCTQLLTILKQELDVESAVK